MPAELETLRDYTLVVCEKPDAAERIAEALTEQRQRRMDFGRVTVFVVENTGKTYVVCAASGHLYTLSDPGGRRTGYPVFDIEWYPTHLVDKRASFLARRVEVFERLAKRAREFIHACDFDVEGETIGYNILTYACGAKAEDALRAKFSTLTPEELRQAFGAAKRGLGGQMAEAGRTRHVVDFLYGVNLSRALSEAFLAANRWYRTISIGRVQGPALSYVVDREIAVRTHVPIPFWIIETKVEADGVQFVANYERDKVEVLSEAMMVKEGCEGKEGRVRQVRSTVYSQAPPTPFNIGDLQREAYRVFGFTPSATMAVAERLYLDALISYPRTSSQKLPPSIDYVKIFRGLRRAPLHGKDADELLAGRLQPREGDKADPAHPAIYPTGGVPRRELEAREKKLYDLIVRRFFAVFGEDALRERLSALLQVAAYSFKVLGRRTLKEGWVKYYRSYTGVEDNPLPPLMEGQGVRILQVRVTEKFESPPPRYNQSSLLEKMEAEGVGTKTTRAEIISTLYERNYVQGDSMAATEVGFAVVETMREFSPMIVSAQMTREMEEDLAGIEARGLEGETAVAKAIGQLEVSLGSIKRSEIQIGRAIRQALTQTLDTQNTLGSCPICQTGRLKIIRSRKTRKRFVGCSNYSKGCRASSPLPQRGTIKPTNKTCSTCGWPIIYVRFTRIPWRICVNIRCPAKKRKKEPVVTRAEKASA